MGNIFSPLECYYPSSQRNACKVVFAKIQSKTVVGDGSGNASIVLLAEFGTVLK